MDNLKEVIEQEEKELRSQNKCFDCNREYEPGEDHNGCCSRLCAAWYYANTDD